MNSLTIQLIMNSMNSILIMNSLTIHNIKLLTSTSKSVAKAHP
jgi:hypothetical protein